MTRVDKARDDYEYELLSSVPEQFRSAGNLVAFLKLYRDPWGGTGKELDLSDFSQADAQNLLSTCWNTARHRGYSDAMAFFAQRVSEHEKDLAKTQEEAGRVPALERDLHNAAAALRHQEEQISRLRDEATEAATELERARDQVRTLLGNSWRYRATEALASGLRRLQEKWSYR